MNEPSALESWFPHEEKEMNDDTQVMQAVTDDPIPEDDEPNPIYDEGLSTAQSGRVQALEAASQLLKRGPFNKVDAADLLKVAQWILDGNGGQQ